MRKVLIIFRHPLFLKIFYFLFGVNKTWCIFAIQNQINYMDNTLEKEPEEVELSEIYEAAQSLDDDEIEIESPDVEFCVETIEKIKRMFDAGSTRSVIAKELNLERGDVIEVLSKYVTRNKINGKNTQTIDFQFDATGKKRIELGDKLNTSVYVDENSTEEQIRAVKKRWLKILNDKND